MFIKSIIFSSLLILAEAQAQVPEVIKINPIVDAAKAEVIRRYRALSTQCPNVISAFEKMGGSVAGVNVKSPYGCCEMEGVTCRTSKISPLLRFVGKM